jgi:hypothetical protein
MLTPSSVPEHFVFQIATQTTKEKLRLGKKKVLRLYTKNNFEHVFKQELDYGITTTHTVHSHLVLGILGLSPLTPC